MTSFSEVRRATCEIVADNATRGTAFVVHPEGLALTCHHVVYGLDSIQVRFPDRADLLDADYVVELSDPSRDVAVLRILGAAIAAVQLGRPRDGAPVEAVGFRPRERAAEPEGHSFSGTLGPGQRLRLDPPATAVARISAAPARAWNVLPEGSREGTVHNFAGAVGLVPGVSGGPVYDRGLRRVVGMMRAVEGGVLGYVISMLDPFDCWAGLEDTNRAAVPDAPLDTLASYGIGLAQETARLPVVPRARSAFAELRRRHSVFGGRERELQRLDAAGDGWTLVTGPAGFGKTSLLANWIERLEQHSVPLAFHFITPRIDDASEEFLLENLCQQLLALHGLAGDLPVNTRGLRFLYADLLRLPPAQDRPVVVVIDGLDEAIGRWEPRPDLFPTELPDGVRVVVSAREMADRDWPAELGLELPAERVIALGRLSRREVADVCARSGISADSLADELFELSDGDPFYLQDLLAELQRSGAGALAALPIGHSAYLRQWWLDGLERAGAEPFADLLGTLAVTRSALTRRQLVVVDPDDALTGASFDLLIGIAARYVEGTDADGYELRHGRIRAFVADRLADQMATYRERLARYCLRWEEPELDAHERDYMFGHAVEHLTEAGRPDAALELLGPRWLAAKWSRYGSYSALVGDFTLAAQAAAAVAPPDAAQVAALAIGRQTARELMLDLPVDLLVAWTRLGEVERVTALLDALTDVRGRAAEPLTRVSAALTESPVHRELAERLLERAVAMLPLVRTSGAKIERLDAIAALLRADRLGTDARERLLDQLVAFARSQREPALRAVAFGLVADAAAPHGAHGHARAAALVEEARAAIRDIDFPPDRVVASAFLLGPLRSLEPAAMAEAARTALAASPDPFQLSSFGSVPIEALLERWAPARDDGPEAEAVLDRLGGEALQRLLGDSAGRLARSWMHLGRDDKAFALVDAMCARSLPTGANAALVAVDELAAANRPRLIALLETADTLAAPGPDDNAAYWARLAGEFARGWATVGRWERALALLERIEPGERADPLTACVGVAVREPDASPRLTRLLALTDGARLEQRARVQAAIAQGLARDQPELARSHAAAAAGIALGDLPEGDTDALRHLATLALHEDGDTHGAIRLAQAMRWPTNVVHAIGAMIEDCAATAPQRLPDLAAAMLEAVQAEGERPSEDALAAAVRAAWPAADAAPELARRVCAYAETAPRDSPRPSSYLGTLAAAAATLTRVDAAEGLAAFERAVLRARGWLEGGEDIGTLEVQTLINGYAPALDCAPDAVRAALASARELAGEVDDPESRIELDCAFATALASVDAPAAAAALHEHLARVDALARVEPAAAGLQRMLAQFTGRLVGPRVTQATAISAVTRSVGAAAGPLAADAAPLLGEALAAIERVESAADRAQALRDLFEACVAPPQPACAIVYRDAIAATGRLGEPQHVVHALGSAAALARAGYADEAQLAIDAMPGTEVRDELATSVEIAAEQAQLGELSPFERAYTADRGADIAHAVLHAIKLEGTAQETLQLLLDRTVNDDLPMDRARMMSGWLPLLAAPVRALSGTAAVVAIVELVEDFDRGLREAAELVAAASTPPQHNRD